MVYSVQGRVHRANWDYWRVYLSDVNGGKTDKRLGFCVLGWGTAAERRFQTHVVCSSFVIINPHLCSYSCLLLSLM